MTTILNKLRSLFLSPDSPFELTLRTFYHKFLSTRIFFLWQDFTAKRSYRKYRAFQRSVPHPDIDPESNQPKITFLLSCLNATSAEVHTTLCSILALYGDLWEVVLVSQENMSDTMFAELSDPRIKHRQSDQSHLSDLITGEYVIYCQAGDIFADSLLIYFYHSLSTETHADLTYYDCEYFDGKPARLQPFFKPTAFSPALLLSVNYLSRAFIHRQTLEKMWLKTDHNTELINQEYDLMLRLCESNMVFRHIPDVLLTQKCLVKPDTPDLQKVLAAHLNRQGLKDVSTSQVATGCRFGWKTGTPSLAIIILSRNNYRFLKSLIPELLAQPFNGQYSFHIVDNDSDDPSTLTYYQKIQQEANISIIPYPQPFNYSEAINLGVANSNSDLVLLMNDDMDVMDELWLSELTQWAIRPEVGVVGAKLLRKNRTIQHVGIILGLTGFMGHIYLNAPEHYNGLFGSVDWYRNYLAITGACQMIRRDVFEEVGGYDLAYELAFGDIDFCIKVHEKGYQNVYTPFAKVFHYEGSSRGYQTPVDDILRGYEQLETYLVEGDPFYSPNLTYTRIPKCVVEKHSDDERLRQTRARKSFYLKNR
jgi:GT2 family glycosyltransferase